MPPRRMIDAAEVEQMMEQRIAAALAAAEVQRGANATQGRPYKEFRNCKPQIFTGTEGPVGLLRWFEKLESVFRISNCAEGDRVKYATSTLQDSALTWWNLYASTIGIDAAYATPWEEVKRMMKDEYCPRNEVQKMEEELWDLKVKGTDINGYTRRFMELAILCPNMVTPASQKIERYIWGLPSQIQGNVTASKKETIEGVMGLARELMDQVVRQEAVTRQTEVRTHDGKRKWDGNQGRNSNQYPNRRQEIVRTFDEGSSGGKGYVGDHPFCSRCGKHHPGVCTVVCKRCKKSGHLARDCSSGTNAIAPGNCFECGQPGHFRNKCPNLKRGN